MCLIFCMNVYETFRILRIIQLDTGSSKKMDGIWNRYNLKSTGRIYTFPQIETFEQERAIFMQDEAPPHFSCFVTDVLNERFLDA